MSAPELVTLKVDGVEVSVPKGTGLVEAALAAGIEIPVFCYEPRLGPPVGACRMCLCEVAPGPPKPQAACTLTVADGMEVKTALTSEMAADAQNSTLEFILVNHPLDCPVCDKGGECPLQDLTFRYGPGNTRMAFPKRTFEKPIPISPTIALDRERCILCYRCTRFSESVAEDGQLVAVARGAMSMIATFEDEPYRAHFSGNVIELCPVGALTSTQYRFQARPWEIQNVPTVCGHCPVGCNVSATTREGKVKRILSRNHPEVDEGWLCDKGRFAFGHLDADDRIVDPLRRASAGFETLTWNDGLDAAERLLRAAGPRIVTALSGNETVEQAYGLARLLRMGLGAHAAVLPEEVPDGLDSLRGPLSSIRDAAAVVVLCEEPVVERAPIVELWIKAARRNGARVLSSLPDAPLVGRVVLVTDDADRAAWYASRCGASAAFYLPRTPNGRGVADAWSAAADGEPDDVEPQLVLISGDEAASDPGVRDLADRAQTVIGIGMFEGSFRGLCDLVLPGTSYLERDGTTVNLEGRLQRQRRAVIAACPDELAWISRLGERFGVEISPYPSILFEEVSAACYGGLAFGDVGERATLPEPAERAPRPAAPTPASDNLSRGGGLRLLTYRPLFSGPAVERTPELEFLRSNGIVDLTRADARTRGIAAGDTVTVSSNGTSVALRARIAQDLRAGAVRIAEPDARRLHETVEVRR